MLYGEDLGIHIKRVGDPGAPRTKISSILSIALHPDRSHRERCSTFLGGRIDSIDVFDRTVFLTHPAVLSENWNEQRSPVKIKYASEYMLVLDYWQGFKSNDGIDSEG